MQAIENFTNSFVCTLKTSVKLDCQNNQKVNKTLAWSPQLSRLKALSIEAHNACMGS